MKKLNTSLITCTFLVCLLTFSMSLVVAKDYDFVGTVSRDGPKESANIIESNVTGLNGTVKVSVRGGDYRIIDYFAEKNINLGFNIEGHYIDGTLVCNAYYSGTNIVKLTFKQLGISTDQICDFLYGNVTNHRCETCIGYMGDGARSVQIRELLGVCGEILRPGSDPSRL